MILCSLDLEWQPACSDKCMSTKDYGSQMLRMRKSRGLTREQVSDQSGVSVSTIQTLENSTESIAIRDTNLDAILTVLAQRAPMGGSEIQVLVHATGRLFESFEALNDRAEQLRRAAMRGPTPPMPHEPTLEERAVQAVHQLISAGQGEVLVAQLEAMVRVYSNEIAQDSRQERAKRQLRVRHPHRRVGDMVIEEISNYDIDDDDQPIAKRPITDPDTRPQPREDSDTMDSTG